MRHTVLLIDDDALQLRIISSIVTNKLNHDVRTATGGKEALEILHSDEGKQIDLVLVDLVMPDMDGLEFIRLAKPDFPQLPFILISASSDVKKAVEAIRIGAIDYIQKDENPARIETSIRNAITQANLLQEVSRLKRSMDGQIMFDDIIGQSKPLKDTIALAKKAADSSIAVLIKGESGVGKELFARAIHGCSERSGKPFVAVNCGAIPETLVESTLFGHEKGAFTGAIYKSLGKFREANGGTLFLDEIGELKLEVQVKLLRALQEGEIEPVGGKVPIKVNVRIISATHRNLKDAVKTGAFREDLYYRLNIFPFTIPPLRERREDIPLLVEYFMNRAALMERKKITGISQEAMQLINEYSWPGNIRQLENVIFRAVVLADNAVLDEDDFMHIREAMHVPCATLPTPSLLAIPDVPASNNLASTRLIDNTGSLRPYCDIEKEILLKALDHCHGNITEASKKLGIGRSTLYRKMEMLKNTG